MENKLKARIINLIETELNIKFSDNINFKYSLLDLRIGLRPRDLLVIFFVLQKSFDITFDDKDILERRFDFLDNIVLAVQEKIANI